LGGLGVALLGSCHRELIIEKSIRFSLANFEVGGGIFIDDQFLRLWKKRLDCEVAAGATFRHDRSIGAIQIFCAHDGGIFSGQKGESDLSIGLGELNGFGTLFRHGERGKDQINFFGDESGDKTIEGDVFDFEGAMESLGELLG